MSSPVWPSAFIRFAVAMCSASSTLRGRPNLVPLARDDALFNAVRSLTSSRSYSASEPRTPIIMRPAAVGGGLGWVAWLLSARRLFGRAPHQSRPCTGGGLAGESVLYG